MIQFNHLQDALARYSQAIADQYKQNLEDSGRRATGQLISSVNTRVSVDGSVFEIELQLEDYYYYAENGRGPGKFPPPDINGKLPTENQLAFLIGRKIANEGFEGTHDLENTMETVDYETIIEEALDQDILEYLDEILMLMK